MPFGGLLVFGAGAGLQALSGWLGSRAANQAGDAQAAAGVYAADLARQAEREALMLQLGMYEQGRYDTLPWLEAGRGGLNRLADLLGIDTRTPSAPAGTTGLGGVGATLPSAPTSPTSQAAIPAGLSYEQFKEIISQYPHGTLPDASLENFYRASYDKYAAGQTAYYPVEFKPPEGAEQPQGTRPPGSSPAWSQPLGEGSLMPTEPSWTPNPRSAQFGSLMQGYGDRFQFDAADMMKDPGYLFRLKEGQKAIESGAAARGGVLSGGTLKALGRFGQDLASQEYGQAYGRAAGEYERNYNMFQQNQANQYNRLASLAGVGQTAAGQLSGAGANFGQQAGNIVLDTGARVGDIQQNIGNARASGYVGGANAIGGALGNIGQLGLDLYGLNRRYR